MGKSNSPAGKKNRRLGPLRSRLPGKRSCGRGAGAAHAAPWARCRCRWCLQQLQTCCLALAMGLAEPLRLLLLLRLLSRAAVPPRARPLTGRSLCKR